MDREKELRWWQFIRNAELREAMRYFPSDKQIKILEIGGKDGYQAKIDHLLRIILASKTVNCFSHANV